MAAAHTAFVTEEGAEKVVRIPGDVRLAAGPVTVREVEGTGEVILVPIRPDAPADDTWEAFLDDMSRRATDTEFMKSRPMNHLPEQDGIFSEE